MVGKTKSPQATTAADSLAAFFRLLPDARRDRAVHRDQLVLICCEVCRRWYVVRVSGDDLRRHHDGVVAQDAFPYLPPGLRELFITGTCPDCWPSSSNPLDYD